VFNLRFPHSLANGRITLNLTPFHLYSQMVIYGIKCGGWGQFDRRDQRESSPISSKSKRVTLVMCSEELKVTPLNTSEEFLLTLAITLCIGEKDRNSFELFQRSLK
jgi:hypothetical protein